MGTNFYFVKNTSAGPEEGAHIGKRSAAGMFCWDCGITLCAGGEDRIHYGDKFHDACPKCGSKRKTETIDEGAAGRELGFNKSAPKPKSGVASCSSFTWGIKPHLLDSMASKASEPIVDEYGHKLTLAEFEAVLSECPVRFYDLIGHDFS